mmetsp:Transcript_866/g.5422  ORF Transcript_866/g.5422 Transcript_866/m.5422 type:complete len:343 (+) Transcript_866:1670-2698(+)
MLKSSMVSLPLSLHSLRCFRAIFFAHDLCVSPINILTCLFFAIFISSPVLFHLPSSVAVAGCMEWLPAHVHVPIHWRHEFVEHGRCRCAVTSTRARLSITRGRVQLVGGSSTRAGTKETSREDGGCCCGHQAAPFDATFACHATRIASPRARACIERPREPPLRRCRRLLHDGRVQAMLGDARGTHRRLRARMVGLAASTCARCTFALRTGGVFAAEGSLRMCRRLAPSHARVLAAVRREWTSNVPGCNVGRILVALHVVSPRSQASLRDHPTRPSVSFVLGLGISDVGRGEESRHQPRDGRERTSEWTVETAPHGHGEKVSMHLRQERRGGAGILQTREVL